MMKFVLIMALGVISFKSSYADDSHGFVVLTYNILGIKTEGYEPWRTRKSIVAKGIRARNPDIVGIQEVRYDYIADDMRQLMRGYHSFPRSRKMIGAPWQNFFYYRDTVFEKVDGGFFFVEKDRSVTWLLLRHRRNRSPLIVMNAHWIPDLKGCDTCPEARVKSAYKMVEWIESYMGNLPIIVMGDLNTRPDRTDFKILLNQGNPQHALNDPFTSFGNSRVDHILQRNLEVTDVSKFRIVENGIQGSDHPMFVASIVIGKYPPPYWQPPGSSSPNGLVDFHRVTDSGVVFGLKSSSSRCQKEFFLSNALPNFQMKLRGLQMAQEKGLNVQLVVDLVTQECQRPVAAFIVKK